LPNGIAEFEKGPVKIFMRADRFPVRVHVRLDAVRGDDSFFVASYGIERGGALEVKLEFLGYCREVGWKAFLVCPDMKMPVTPETATRELSSVLQLLGDPSS